MIEGEYMREIYLMNKGDTVDKIKYELGVDDITISDEKVFGYKFAEIERGSDDVSIVKNYLPLFSYIVENDDNYLDILARGFKIDSAKEVITGDTIILSKPRSIRYVVSPLETLDEIALKFGVSKINIMQNNSMKTEKLFVGQILWI